MSSDKDDLTDWLQYALAWVGATVLIGKLDAEAGTLSGVLELELVFEKAPNGLTKLTHTAQPVLYLPSMDRVVLPAGAMVKPVSELGPHDQRSLRSAVRSGWTIRDRLRGAQAGVLLGVPR